MVLTQHRRVIGVFSNRYQAEQALNLLKAAHFQATQIFLATKDPRYQPLGQDKVMRGMVDQARQGAITGSVQGLGKGNVWGTATGLVLGLGVLAIPGVGPVLLASGAGTALAFALTSGTVGAAAGGLIGGLIGLAVTESQMKEYNKLVSQGEYIIMVSGSDNDVQRAESILSSIPNC
jgi:hypothetical protein